MLYDSKMGDIDDTYIPLFKHTHAPLPFSVLPKPAVQQACRDSYVSKELTAIHFEEPINRFFQIKARNKRHSSRNGHRSRPTPSYTDGRMDASLRLESLRSAMSSRRGTFPEILQPHFHAEARADPNSYPLLIVTSETGVESEPC